MQTESKPTIDLDFDRVVCARHGEPFRRLWPRGFTEFATNLLDAWVDPKYMDVTGTSIEASSIMSDLDEKPLCERVKPVDLEFAYISSGIGRDRPCELCHQMAPGAPYAARTTKGDIRHFRHICFACVSAKLTPVN